MSQQKLNKQLLQGLADAGIAEVTEFQGKLVSRAVGGASFYLVDEHLATAGTSAITDSIAEKQNGLVIAVLQKMNYSMPDTPRTVVVAATNEEAELIHEKFRIPAKQMDLKILLAHEGGNLDHQNMAIYAGADIIVVTPKRLIKLYFQCGVNVNKMNTFVLYNASAIVEARFHPEIDRFTDSLPKFQGIVYTSEINEKLRKVCRKFMIAAQVVE